MRHHLLESGMIVSTSDARAVSTTWGCDGKRLLYRQPA